MYDTPTTIKQRSSGYFRCTIQEEMLARREVECIGPIDAESVYSLTRQMRYLESQDSEAGITLLINSPGGEVSSGLALYDVMKSLSCPVRTVCLGTAASMAAILFAAGAQRDILPHGRVMIHDPLISGGVGGSALEIPTISATLPHSREALGDILAQCTGRSREEIYEKTARDTFFSAQEAIDFGLADNLIHKI